MASTPSPMFIGVERVVVACDIDALSPAERRAVCDQLIRKAKVYTDIPVTAASASDLDPIAGELGQQSKQLVLKVSGRARDVEPGRKSLSLAVTPVRLARAGLGLPGPETSTASLVRVQGKWVLQGPVAAFGKLLGTSGRMRLHRPIRSDS